MSFAKVALASILLRGCAVPSHKCTVIDILLQNSTNQKEKRGICYLHISVLGLLVQKIKMFACFVQTSIHSIIKLHCIYFITIVIYFQFSEEYMQEISDMMQFNSSLSWTKAEWVMGYKWSFWFQENLHVNKSEEKNSGQISVASKGDRFREGIM